MEQNAKHSAQPKGKAVELTVEAVVLGVVLSVVMGAANVYLGLKAGMTVSASIPAAVIAMGILRGIMRRRSVLEANLVQTSASAGESLAAGIIFTVPALVIVGLWESFDYVTTTMIAFSGGMLGVLLMIPMRKVFVVDNPELKFPEGVACAEVLRAGEGDSEEAGNNAQRGVVLVGLGLVWGAAVKFASTFLGVLRETVRWSGHAGNRVWSVGMDASPALIGVGFIVGLPIAIQVFTGGALAWFVALPILSGFISVEGSAAEQADKIWGEYVRFIGVGAMVVGGIASIYKVRHGLLSASREMSKMLKGGSDDDQPATEQNLPGSTIIALTFVTFVLIVSLYYSLLGHAAITAAATIAMLVMSFFFTAVASYIVGLVGNSNSPVSGMTITAVLGTAAFVGLFGFGGDEAILATLGVAGIVCCVACTSGDVCNDLKTGHLVGASPRKQQIMQVIGVAVASVVMAPVLIVLHEGSINAGKGGIGGEQMAAPQATLFASLVKGFFGDGQVPYTMVAIGAGVGVVILIADRILAAANSRFRLHVMPVAVGMYLPLGLSTPILAGGVLSWLVGRAGDENADKWRKSGVLIMSGAIAGESLVGVLLGFLNYMGFMPLEALEYLSHRTQPAAAMHILGDIVTLAAIAIFARWVWRRSCKA
jgi:putative OPT family oligopeptide transporter